MTLDIQRLSLSDASEAAELHARAFPAHEAWSEAAICEELNLPTVTAWGIRGGERRKIVAMILVQRAASDAEILTLASDPDHRRKGLAAALIEHSRQHLSSLGVERLLLDVAADNLGALALYQSREFAVDGRRKRYFARPGGIPADCILMSLSIAGQTNC